MGLRPLVYWDCGFESCRGHGCLSLVNVLFCQVEVSASGWSPIQRSHTECGMSDCDRELSIVRRPWPYRSWCAIGGLNNNYFTGFSSIDNLKTWLLHTQLMFKTLNKILQVLIAVADNMLNHVSTNMTIKSDKMTYYVKALLSYELRRMVHEKRKGIK